MQNCFEHLDEATLHQLSSQKGRTCVACAYYSFIHETRTVCILKLSRPQAKGPYNPLSVPAVQL
jgi:hypothetical protein